MKHALKSAFLTISFFTSSFIVFAQTPDLGTTSGFAFFTAIGAFTNVGASQIAGDIGTNVGALTGFPPGTLVGQAHISDAVTVQAAIDVNIAYSYLFGLTCNTVLGTTLGNNQQLTPGVYCIGTAATLNANLILNGQGNPNSFFLIKIDGAFSSNPFSTIQLTNGASPEHLFWQINGQVTLGESSSFSGNILANGAIHLLEAATLHGRGLSREGLISLHNNNTYIGPSVLNLKLFIQGYYRGEGTMDHVLMNQGVVGADILLTDTIAVELRNAISPYETKYAIKTNLKTNGQAICNFPASGTFYIAVKHRNGLQTWSKKPIAISGANMVYNLSDSASKAFGNNLKLMETGVYALYSGDINQDSNMDLLDLGIQETDINNFAYGYFTSDLNGDGNTDLLDIPILEQNINNFIYAQQP